MNKDTKIILTISLIVILIIATILFVKKLPSNIEEKTIKCIAEKSKIYSSSICTHCKTQKEILGEYYEIFNVTDCLEDSEICQKAEIQYTPTWEINGIKHVGVKSIEELKKLTDC